MAKPHFAITVTHTDDGDQITFERPDPNAHETQCPDCFLRMLHAIREGIQRQEAACFAAIEMNKNLALGLLKRALNGEDVVAEAREAVREGKLH